MRGLLQAAQTGLRRFIQQRDDLLCLVRCGDDDVAVALKLLRDLEAAGDADVFLLFADEYDDARTFVSRTMVRLRDEHAEASGAAVEQGGAPLPALPDALFDEAIAPAQRVQQAMIFARGLLPPGGDNHLIWAMIPQKVGDQEEYARCVAAMGPRHGSQPWMEGLRSGVRAPVDDSLPDGAPRTRSVEVDFSPEAIAASMEQDAADQSLAVDERMQALLSLALLDFAHARYETAGERLDTLLSHYQQTDDPGMQATVLNCMGDIHHRQDQLNRAQHHYECAVPLAARAAAPPEQNHGTDGEATNNVARGLVPRDGAEAPASDEERIPTQEEAEAEALAEAEAARQAASMDAPVVFFTVVRNLGEVAFKRGRFAMAEECFENADKLAACLLDPDAKARALLWRGLSQERQGKQEPAIASWEDAATLCRSVELDYLLVEALGHLSRVYPDLGRDAEAAAARAELEALQRAQGGEA